MTNYMVITCKQKNGNLLVLKHIITTNYPLIFVLWFFGLKKYVLLSKKFFCLKKSDLSLQNFAFSILITIFVPVHNLRLRAKVTNTND